METQKRNSRVCDFCINDNHIASFVKHLKILNISEIGNLFQITFLMNPN